MLECPIIIVASLHSVCIDVNIGELYGKFMQHKSSVRLIQ